MNNQHDNGICRIMLIVAGEYHDFDFVRRELLGLLAEDDRIETCCTHDFEALHSGPMPDMLVTYTGNVFPVGEQLTVLRNFVHAGGRWLAIHGSAAFTCFQPPEIDFGGIKLPGLTATPDRQPEYMDLLGCRLVSHLVIQSFKIGVAGRHPITAGLPAFEVSDEPYILETRGACEILLESRYTGEAPGYVEGPWLSDDPRPQLLLHRYGEGEVLYLAPGHASGRFTLRPYIDEMPAHTGPWLVPEYREVIRRAIRWGGRLSDNFGTAANTTIEIERAIERVAAEIDRAVDEKRWDTLKTFYTDCITVDIGVLSGATMVEMRGDAFVAEVEALNPLEKTAYHSRTNNLIEVRGAHATLTAHSYGWNVCSEFNPSLYEVWGSLDYGLVRQNERWLVNHVRMTKWREAGNPAVSEYRRDKT